MAKKDVIHGDYKFSYGYSESFKTWKCMVFSAPGGRAYGILAPVMQFDAESEEKVVEKIPLLSELLDRSKKVLSEAEEQGLQALIDKMEKMILNKDIT